MQVRIEKQDKYVDYNDLYVFLYFSAKYPHLACNGLLLASKNTEKSKVEIVDAVPLFHQCLHVTPMAEIALIQVIY